MKKKKKTLLDLDRVPTLDELCAYFKENDFSTATYIDMDYDKLDSEDVEALEHIKGLMDEKWEPLSREMGLKSDSSYYGKDNPLIAMRDNMENLVAGGVLKLLTEKPDLAAKILASYLEDPDVEKHADGFLNNTVKTAMQVMNYEELAQTVQDNVWEMVSDSSDQPELLGDAIISLLSAFMKSTPHFIGTLTGLAYKLFSQSGEKISPKKISQRILQNADALTGAGISFDIRRSNGKRLIELTRADGDDSADKTETTSDIPNIAPVNPVRGGLDAEALPFGEASKASGYTPPALSGALPHTPVTKGA